MDSSSKWFDNDDKTMKEKRLKSFGATNGDKKQI